MADTKHKFQKNWRSVHSKLYYGDLGGRKICTVDFDEDKVPPDWKLAEDHRNSRMVGIEREFTRGVPVNLCDCCGYQVNFSFEKQKYKMVSAFNFYYNYQKIKKKAREKLSLNCKPVQLGFLGAGYPLFLYFIKYLIFVLFVLLLSSGGYNIISNYYGSYCIPHIPAIGTTGTAETNLGIPALGNQTSALSTTNSTRPINSSKHLNSEANIAARTSEKLFTNNGYRTIRKKRNSNFISMGKLATEKDLALKNIAAQYNISTPKADNLSASPNKTLPSPTHTSNKSNETINSSNTTQSQMSQRAYDYLEELLSIISYSGEQYCHLDWIMMLSLPNKMNSPTLKKIQEYTNLASVILFIFLFHWWRFNMRKLNNICDKTDIQASDYTIQIKNISKQFEKNRISELKSFLEEKLSLSVNPPKNKSKKQSNEDTNKTTHKPTITKINLGFDLKELEHLKKKKNEAIKFIQKLMIYKEEKKGSYPNDTKYNFYESEGELKSIIENHKSNMNKIQKECYEGNSEFFAGWAFVSFNTEQEKDDIIEKYRSNFKRKLWRYLFKKDDHVLKYHDKELEIGSAPEASDIIWENLKYGTLEKIIRRLLGYLIIILTISAVAAGMFFLLYLQEDIKKKENFQRVKGESTDSSTLTMIIGLAIALAIPFVNFILVGFIKWVADFEKYATRTECFLKIVTNVSFAQFLNTAVLTFLINLFYTKNLYGPGGLIFNQNMVFIFNILIPIGMHATFPAGIMNSISRWRELSKKKSFLTQMQAHLLFEKPTHNMAESLGELMKNMLFTAFYAPILPLGIVWTLLGTIALYWIHKYNILRRVTVKYNLGMKLIVEATELLEVFLILFSVTNLIFDYLLFKTVSIIQIITLGLAFLNAILPMQKINKHFINCKFCEWEKSEEDESSKPLIYDIAMDKFDTDYERENPATQKNTTALLLRKKEVLKDKPVI